MYAGYVIYMIMYLRTNYFDAIRRIHNNVMRDSLWPLFTVVMNN